MYVSITQDSETTAPSLALVSTKIKNVLFICMNYICLCHSTRLEASVSGWKSMLDVNVIALCLCTKESVNSMRQRGVDDGQIIHISRYGFGKARVCYILYTPLPSLLPQSFRPSSTDRPWESFLQRYQILCSIFNGRPSARTEGAQNQYPSCGKSASFYLMYRDIINGDFI